MQYISTRGNYKAVRFAESLTLGMVPRGGLFVPEKIPQVDIRDYSALSYQELSARIMLLYTGVDFNAETVRKYTEQAYSAHRFETVDTAPVKSLPQGPLVLELWHGPTAAFKDMALQLMPSFLSGSKTLLGNKKRTLILVATSGDTGKAALEGYRDIPGIDILVFYPKGGVSRVQEMQMLTTAGKNTRVVAVKGNFDDCQNLVKALFADEAFNKKLSDAGVELSSANSINWGRLSPQIVYYFRAYYAAVQERRILMGDPLNFVVPTGNFGNILAGFYAREMGLPIKTLVCASNRNNVLTDFIRTGTYNRKRPFHKTSSPSMDILISSNLERFLFEMSRHGAGKVARWYQELGDKGQFKVDDTTRQRMNSVLWGGFTTEEETAAAVKNTWEKWKYLIDTHTAVGFDVYAKYQAETSDKTPAVIVSTASPFKFNQAVYQALGGHAEEDEFTVLSALSDMTGVPVHRSLAGLDSLPRMDEIVIGLSDGPKAVLAAAGVKGS